MRLLVLSLALLVAEGSSAAIYRKVEAGRIILSDQPFEGAEQMPDRPVNMIQAPSPGKAGAGKVAPAKPAPAGRGYQLEVLEPRHKGVYEAHEVVALSMSMAPALRKGDVLEVRLDGVPIDAGRKLTGLPAGDHVLELRVLSAGGEAVLSRRIEFQVRAGVRRGDESGVSSAVSGKK